MGPIHTLYRHLLTLDQEKLTNGVWTKQYSLKKLTFHPKSKHNSQIHSKMGTYTMAFD